MNKENPTFEELIGEENVESFNEINEGELSLVSALANKQVQLAQELASLEEAVKAKQVRRSLYLSFITLIYLKLIKTQRING